MIRLVASAEADVGLLAAVHAEAFDAPWTAGDFESLLSTAGTVAALAGNLDGFVLLRSVAGEAEILTLAVRPTARRQGLGLALMGAAQAAAAGLGSEVLWLEVAADNDAALALYRRAGFEEAGRRPRYYQRADGIRMDAVLMRRTLNTAGASA